MYVARSDKSSVRLQDSGVGNTGCLWGKIRGCVEGQNLVAVGVGRERRRQCNVEIGGVRSHGPDL
jgi:hypothetical protein